MIGFREIYFGRKEPQNRYVLWVKPSDDQKSAELYFFGSDGWTLMGTNTSGDGSDLSIINKAISSATYDSDKSTISFYNSGGDLLSSIVLENLNETIVNVEGLSEWATSGSISIDELDTLILEVEDETEYGMADAMGVEG